jgi:hypothetical protein
MKYLHETTKLLIAKLDPLLKQEKRSYAEATPALFPNEPGVYVITSGWDVMRAGKTTSLRQRLYSNHLMGDQPGNLRAQLVRSGMCSDLVSAKAWIRANCTVQFLVIEDEAERSQIEHFMLSVVQPKFCDNNKIN